MKLGENLTQFTLTTADPTAALTSLHAQNIPVYQIRHLDDLTVRLQIRRKDVPYIRQWARKRGDQLEQNGERGILRYLLPLKKRKLLVTGCLFWLCMVFWVPSKIWFVQIEGNETIPTKQILAAAEDCGICFGASRREVRSEKMKNALLSSVPQLQWAGINTKGCVAVISVQERRPEGKQQQAYAVSSIIAARDAVIDYCTATKGNLLCAPGDTVKAGQTLISGYTDCGLYLRATQADGEVYGQTNRKITVISPTKIIKLTPTTGVKRKISLILGKKRIKLWKDSGIWDTTCGRMYVEYYVTLPGGFSLPLALAVDTYAPRQPEPGETAISHPTLEAMAQQYLHREMIAGQILKKEETMVSEDGVQHFTGSYLCREMIGRVQPEQIGDNYVEND